MNLDRIQTRFVEDPDSETIRIVTRLYRDAGWWDLGPDDDDHVSRIIRGSHCFVVASIDGRVIGMGRAISDRASDAYIQDVTVDSACRRQGAATAMLRALVQRLREDGIRWIGVIAENATDPLYRQHGFLPMDAWLPLLLRT